MALKRLQRSKNRAPVRAWCARWPASRIDHRGHQPHRPRTCASHRSTSSNACSRTSSCGNPLNADQTSRPCRTICRVRWQCGSSSAPITTSGPTMARTRSSRSPSQSSYPSATIAPCSPSSTISTGNASRRSASSSSRRDSQEWRVVIPLGARGHHAFDHRQPVLAHARAAHRGPAKKVMVRVLAAREISASRNVLMPVGIGAKVLVSVARDAVNTRMAGSARQGRRAG